MELACYVDFTCGYSYRAWRWLDRLRSGGVDLDIRWRGFVLKEVNRGEGEPSLLAGPTIDSVAVLALAVARALPIEASAAYRVATFDAMHGREGRPTRDEVVRIAIQAGLDADAFWQNETLWLEQVRDEHMLAVSRWGVFGTPTLVFDDRRAIYLKLAEIPDNDAGALWDSVATITRSFPQVTELKRPSPPL